MASEVYTETRCDRCCATHRRQGAHGCSVPDGWASFVLLYPNDTAKGWRMEMTLCAGCALDVRDYARRTPPLPADR